MRKDNTPASRMERARNLVVPAVLAGATVVAIAITSVAAAHARRATAELATVARTAPPTAARAN